MDVPKITGENLAVLNRQVEEYNRSIVRERTPQLELGKEEFLKLLITQLSHQDPTQPLEDREFVAQMAQFSTLEQMTNMSGELSQLLGLLARSQAVSLLGKTVEIAGVDGQASITGRVEAISGSQYPQLLVEGRYYDVTQVLSVKE